MPAARIPRSTPRPSGTVRPAWLLQTGLAVLAVGLFCAYLTLCVLFYLAQWQFVLHPSRTVAHTPASDGLSFQPIRFGDDVSGQPQLTGWWVPSDLPTDPTVLMLHSETGSMSDALPSVHALHNARLNVFVFDYRGYGASGGRHPTERLMQADAHDALLYLTQTRSIPLNSILVYGRGLGASLAVQLCTDYPAIPALILQSADGDTATRVSKDARTQIIPIRWLFRERFPLADPLSRLRTPKLLISFTDSNPPLEAQRAADPKITVELAPTATADAITPVVRRFVDTYLFHPPGVL